MAPHMTVLAAKVIWLAGLIGWFIIRYPHQRRSRRISKVRQTDRRRELLLLSISFSGLFLVPLFYVLTDEPRFANYTFRPLQAWPGVLTVVLYLALFYRTHKDLGRFWSVTLEIREGHAVVTRGVYSRVRHPMYAAFWLCALAQALLLPNWIAGLSGLVGFGTLFFLRVGKEEQLMLETFGEEYRQYMARTNRIIPGIY
jgi:protein-S-isoprenylcysteine O-methyltransferase Ste14